MEIELGSYKVRSAQDTPSRFAALLWGDAGTFKTTLSATAPGKKLWILFDNEGLSSVVGLRETAPTSSALSNELLVLDLSTERNNVIDKFKRDDGLGLAKILSDDAIGIDTVVVDSVSRASEMALEHMIAQGIHKSARLELPGMGSYGGRNALMLRLFVDILNVTGRFNKNVIFITHEAAPSTNDDGVVTSVTMMLGGQLPQMTTQKLNEVWYVRDTAKNGREIYIRPFGAYKPMKTRMFSIGPKDPTSFKWDYDINDPNPKMEIATWWKEFSGNGYKKLSLPKP